MLLPVSVKPIIVADAGFRGLWFHDLLELGWDFFRAFTSSKCSLYGVHLYIWDLSLSYFEQENPNYG